MHIFRSAVKISCHPLLIGNTRFLWPIFDPYSFFVYFFFPFAFFVVFFSILAAPCSLFREYMYGCIARQERGQKRHGFIANERLKSIVHTRYRQINSLLCIEYLSILDLKAMRAINYSTRTPHVMYLILFGLFHDNLFKDS